jgi:hypothetical protein
MHAASGVSAFVCGEAREVVAEPRAKLRARGPLLSRIRGHCLDIELLHVAGLRVVMQ